MSFPSFYASGDEHSYIKTANLLSKGQIIEEDIFYAAGSVNIENGFIPNVPINFPLFIIPFVYLGIPFIFLFSLLLHIINTILVSTTFSKLNISQKYVFLYAFFPALLWLSRTLYAQSLAITFLLAGFLLYLTACKEKNHIKQKMLVFASAFVFGFAVFIRPDASILMMFFSLVVIWKKRLTAIFFFLGFIIPAALLFLINTILYGNLVTTAYGKSGLTILLLIFSRISIFDIAIYLLAFIIFFPLMLFSFMPKLKNKYNLELFSLFLGGLIIQAGMSDLSTFIINPASFYFLNFRYLALGIPFILITYAFFLDSFLSKKINVFFEKIKCTFLDYNKLFFISIFILILACLAFSFVHQDFISKREDVRKQIISNTPEDALIIGSSDDKIYFMKDLLPKRRYLRIDLNSDVRGFEKNAVDYFDEKTYIMQLTYSNRDDSNAPRQILTINVERDLINSFIKKNISKLELLFETNVPHNLKIYKWIN